MEAAVKRRSSKQNVLPAVQIIGAQKAGTSAIADWLFESGGFSRPLVFDGEPFYYSKEVHFFDDGARFHQGVDFYAKRFKGGRTMDATPDTLPFAKRVWDTYEAAGQAHSVKLIVILREPVSRELSLYNHLAFDCRRLGAAERTPWHRQVARDDGSIMSFDEFVMERSIPALHKETGPGRSTRHSLYATHLAKWFDLFHRSQILVLSYDELQSDPEKLQGRIQAHIGNTAIPGTLSRSNSNDNEYKILLPSREARQALQAQFAPHEEELYQLLESNPGPPIEQRPFPRFREPDTNA